MGDEVRCRVNAYLLVKQSDFSGGQFGVDSAVGCRPQ